MAFAALLTHVTALTGGVAASLWVLRRSSDTLLRFIAAMVAILASDKRSRADRALEVLRTLNDKSRRAVEHKESNA
jgi:hypothetical protein